MIPKILLQAVLLTTIIITLFSFTTPKNETSNVDSEKLFLKEGSKVPNFVTKDVLGNKIKLNKVLKKSNVLITFLRPAWCPICNARTHELIEYYKEMQEKGIEIIAIYPSSEEELKGYVKDMDIPFTVIADPDEVLFKLYGIERSAAKYKRTMEEESALKDMKKGQELYKKNGNDYGGLREVTAAIIPADFIISQSKIIKTAHYGNFVGDHIAVKNIEENLTNNFNLSDDAIRF
jgi:peroxiredoxin